MAPRPHPPEAIQPLSTIIGIKEGCGGSRQTMARYGGFWQELRATIAAGLMSLAMLIHAQSVIDAASDIAKIRKPSS